MLGRINRGSYGDVWLAQSVTGQWRAIKIIRRDDFISSEPFDREFRGIQRVEECSRTHPNLAQILHVGRDEQDRYFYYVLELADGARAVGSFDPESYTPRTLMVELQDNGPLTVVGCLETARNLAQGLLHLHKHQLVHRDLKPSNVIFVAGVPKLADFGAVTTTEAAASQVGTPGYIPPEGPGRPQGDIYSLGRVLYDMTWGISNCAFPELPVELTTLPDWRERLKINEVIVKACDPDPSHRHQSMEEVLEELEAVSRDGIASGSSGMGYLPRSFAINRSTLGLLFPSLTFPAALLSTGKFSELDLLEPLLVLGLLQLTLILVFRGFDALLDAGSRRKLLDWLVSGDPGESGRTVAGVFALVLTKCFSQRHWSWRCLLCTSFYSLLATVAFAIAFFFADLNRMSSGSGYTSRLGMVSIFFVGGIVLTIPPNFLAVLMARWGLSLFKRKGIHLATAILVPLHLLLGLGVSLCWIGFVSAGWGRSFYKYLDVNEYLLSNIPAEFYNFGIYTFIDGIGAFLRANFSLHDLFGVFIYAGCFGSLVVCLLSAVSFLTCVLLRSKSGQRLLQLSFQRNHEPARMMELVALTVASSVAISSYTTHRILSARQSGIDTQSMETVRCPMTAAVLVKIPAGKFLMGPTRDSMFGGDQQWVELSEFYIGRYEVTQREWGMIMEKNPSFWSGMDLPVDAVTWDQAKEFTRRLNQRSKLLKNNPLGDLEYRLPTEAEWEYACRAGSTNRFHFPESRMNEYAWTIHNSGGRTHPGGLKLPNRWSLYDMNGNLREWCEDWRGALSDKSRTLTNPTGPSSGELKVIRGGSWYSDGRLCDATSYQGNRPGEVASRPRFGTIGFRLALYHRGSHGTNSHAGNDSVNGPIP